MGDDKVKIFSLSTCSHCRASKKLLTELSVEFDFIDVDLLKGDERKETIAEVKKYNERCSFPTIVIGDKALLFIFIIRKSVNKI